MTRTRLSTLAVALLAAATAPALAQAPSVAAPLRNLEACRAIAADPARLACYDRVAAELTTAERSGDVVVIDREQARAAREQAFGFNLPSLNLFKRGAEKDFDRLTLTVTGAFQAGDGKWVFRTEGDQTWRQVDNEPLGRRPRAGSKLEVRRAAMGSYLANVDGQRAVRIRREQ